MIQRIATGTIIVETLLSNRVSTKKKIKLLTKSLPNKHLPSRRTLAFLTISTKRRF